MSGVFPKTFRTQLHSWVCPWVILHLSGNGALSSLLPFCIPGKDQGLSLALRFSCPTETYTRANKGQFPGILRSPTPSLATQEAGSGRNSGWWSHRMLFLFLPAICFCPLVLTSSLVQNSTVLSFSVWLTSIAGICFYIQNEWTRSILMGRCCVGDSWSS